MNTVYKLIFNVSTGTWAVASELTRSRGKKSRTRLAAALLAVLAAPAGSALAADSPQPLSCAANETVSADGLRCEMTPGSTTRAAGTIFAGTDSYEAGGGTATGSQSVAIGQGANITLDTPTEAVAIGYGATVVGRSTDNKGAIAIGSGAYSGGLGSIAVGNSARVDGSLATAIGRNAFASRGTALGANARATVSNSVALGDGSIANRGSSVSIGSDDPTNGFTRQLTNLSAGTEDSDAVAVSQLKSVAAALGGNAGVNADGSIRAPSYSVDGTTVTTVGDALTNIDGRVTATRSTLDQLKTEIESGTIGLVQQDATSKAINVAASTDGELVNFAGTQGARTLSGIKDGTLAAGSTQAVTGSQLFDTNNRVTAVEGAVGVLQEAGKYAKVRGSTAANAVGGRGIAIGDGAYAGAVGNTGGDTNIAIGASAVTSGGLGQIALGHGATTVGNFNGGAIAIGRNANTHARGVALGDHASVTANNSVALGDASLANRANAVSIGSNDPNGTFTRQLTNVSAGTQDSDAVTVSQLKGVAAALGGNAGVNADGSIRAPSYSVGGTTVTTVGDALTNIDTRVTNNADDITTLQDSLANGTVGLVTYDDASGTVSVAGDKGGTTVDFAGVDANGVATARTLTNVAAGGVSATSTDAINGSQLHGTAQSVANGLGGGSVVNADGTVSAPNYSVGGTTVTNIGDAITNIDGRTTTNAGDIADLQDNLANGTVGLVTYDDASGTVSVAGDKGGTTVDFAGVDANGVATARTLTNVAAGGVSATSTDAINGSQLHGTAQSVANGLGGGSVVNADGTVSAPSYSVGGTRVTNVGDALTNIDTRVITNADDITTLTSTVNNLSAGSAGLVTYDGASGTVSVAGDKGGTTVDFAGVDANGVATARTLTNVAAGSVSATSSDAVNGSQLFATNANVTALTGRVDVAEDDIKHLQGQIDSGTIGLVQQDASSKAINVAAGTDGDLVNFAGTQGVRTLSGIKGATLSATSDEAVTGAQLHASNERLLDAEGDIISLQGDVTRIDGDVTQLDSRTTYNESNINNLSQQVTELTSGSVGIVTHDAAAGTVQVAAQLGGNEVNLAGMDGDRRIHGVANGTRDNDAATIAQLKASGLVDPNNGRALGALVYDDMSLDRATLGGTHGTVVANLGNGLIAAGSREAVNGGQLWQMRADWEARWNQLDGRVDTIEQGIANGSIGGPGQGVLPGTGDGSVAIGDGSQAGGEASIGIGNGAAAGGDGAVAIGEGSQAGGEGSVGIGNGAGAGGNGSVAIGDGSQAGGAGSIGIGNGAGAAGEGSVAIGEGASATGDNSVAIGAGSTADRDNEFSVGSQGGERVVSNVAAGTRPTDAVNVQQMEDRFTAERNWAEGQFQAIDKRFDRMGAMSAAYAGMALNTAGLQGENRVGAGIGQQNGRSALAVGYQRVLGEKKNVSVSLGGAFSGSDKSMSAGAGFSW